tara:strand:- start:1151 stop:1480 length:330 start_codon:yes stop_codon:yes gene_type:complete
MNDTVESNMIIAEFMGGEVKKVSPLFTPSHQMIDTENMDCYISLNKLTRPQALRYKSSWDWLMPVVERCYHNGAEENEVGDITHALLDCNRDHLYISVVEFIKLHNENK